MSLLFAVTLAAATQSTCSWDHPGQNPYTGSAAAAVDRYTDIPADVRGTLKRRIEEVQPDDTVNITRDQISGKYQYNPAIRDMHFGAASVCNTVTRSKWAASRSEPGAVYCVGEHCILVPRICGNVSRISRTNAVAAQLPPQSVIELIDSTPEEFAALNEHELGLIDAPPRLDHSNDALSHDGIEDALAQADLDSDAAARKRALGANGLDNDQVAQPVPEAQTWAMLVAGLALIGGLTRRRARAAANNQR
jgi:hypothetical protein